MYINTHAYIHIYIFHKTEVIISVFVARFVNIKNYILFIGMEIKTYVLMVIWFQALDCM